MLEGDIGGGLVLQRQICIPKNDSKVFRIDSSIIARKVGAGSGGYSRFALNINLFFLQTYACMHNIIYIYNTYRTYNEVYFSCDYLCV